jgi:hypothetical protein
MQLLSLALLLPAAWAATTIRRLEDYNEDAVDGYFKFSQCIRVKVPQDNDDDGNAYFYNGSYRSQSIAYASFLKCEAGCDGTCDPTTAYVAELDAVLQYALTYAGSYCDACTYSCRRRLEEGGDEDGGNNANYNVANVDCNTCVDACARVNGGGSGGSDESDYLDCQYSFTDDNGLDYYSAPTCGSDGSLALGLFYDGTWGRRMHTFASRLALLAGCLSLHCKYGCLVLLTSLCCVLFCCALLNRGLHHQEERRRWWI